MKDEILALLPEINLIKDSKLKKSVLEVYEEAIKKGGWKVEDLEKIPFTLLIKDTKISFLKHVRGVTKTSIKAAETLRESYGDEAKINMDHLIAGAVLHDIGKLLEYKREGNSYLKSRSGNYLRHPFSGMAIAFGKGLPDEVLHMIAVHAAEGDHGKRSTEAIILHHADFTNFEIFKP